jgi:hypothetical protein
MGVGGCRSRPLIGEPISDIDTQNQLTAIDAATPARLRPSVSTLGKQGSFRLCLRLWGNVPERHAGPV